MRLASRLELESALPFHAHRDRILEVAHVLSSLALTCGKMASDIILMMQTEVGEVFEGAGVGRGGSSAMPHKRNPALSTLVVASCSQLTGLMANLYANSMGEHERAAGAWQSEWLTFPLIIKLVGSVTHRMVNLCEGLEVKPEKMKANLDITLGLVYSEKLKSALVPLIGRNEAHEAIELASKEAISKGKHLKNSLSNDILKLLDKTQLDNIFNAENAIGDAANMVDRVLGVYKP
jgi:3-carboxy-cis,cis-muconate cycloisomerase